MTAAVGTALHDALAQLGVAAAVEWRGRLALLRLHRADDIARCAQADVRDALLVAAKADGAVTCAVTFGLEPAAALTR